MSRRAVVMPMGVSGVRARRADENDRGARGTGSAAPPNAGHALQEGASFLGGVSDVPRVEAEVLLTHVVGWSRAELLAHPERSLTQAQAVQFSELVADRAAGYPLPHLTGEVEFYGLDVAVTPEVLIPRPETEVLVDLALERLADRGEPTTVIDVGTGCGCIAVALASHLPEGLIYAIDISPPALAVARQNAERHGLDGRIRFMVGDLLDRRPGPVDLIVSNPPYVTTDEWAELPPSIRDHEPRLALDGGADGLEVIRRLLRQSQGLLAPGGALLIEIGATQGGAVKEIAQRLFAQSGITIRVHPDLAGRDRVLEIQV